MTEAEAETVALDALAWLLSERDLWPVYSGATGLAEADLRGRASDPELLVSVLEFVTMDDAWVTRFTQSAGLPPQAALAALQALPGGAAPHWT
jgi:hypothetical protein